MIKKEETPSIGPGNDDSEPLAASVSSQDLPVSKVVVKTIEVKDEPRKAKEKPFKPSLEPLKKNSNLAVLKSTEPVLKKRLAKGLNLNLGLAESLKRRKAL